MSSKHKFFKFFILVFEFAVKTQFLIRNEISQGIFSHLFYNSISDDADSWCDELFAIKFDNFREADYVQILSQD